MLSAENEIRVSNMVIIVQDKMLWYYFYDDLRSYMESYFEQRSITNNKYV